jgi:2-dehydro-3-deoxyphosphogluconate aldolase/(4S)-4-hydroxy-2-oxoglutarate aldolase
VSSFLKFKVLPVLVIQNAQIAPELASCLIDSGLPIVEVTLRTEDSWKAIEKLASYGDLTLGIGSVTQEIELRRGRDLGVKFAVSAGFAPDLVATARELDLDYLPGVATASEILGASRAGLQNLKWFPAAALGGIPALRSVSAPFPNMNFIPTGGIDLAAAIDYLKEPNVKQVGGSWMLKQDWLAARDFTSISESIQECMSHLKDNN